MISLKEYSLDYAPAQTRIRDSELYLAHRMCLLLWTQRICHQSWAQRDQRGFDGSCLLVSRQT